MAVLKVPPLSSADDLLSLVEAAGFLPFMRSGIEGFSVQEYTPEERWFVKDVEGPWEWRETLAERGVIAYGKVFDKKAGFISPAYYPDFVNWRRGGLDFADRYDAGLASRAEKRIMDLLVERGPCCPRTCAPSPDTRGLRRRSPRCRCAAMSSPCGLSTGAMRSAGPTASASPALRKAKRRLARRSFAPAAVKRRRYRKGGSRIGSMRCSRRRMGGKWRGCSGRAVEAVL